MENISTTVEAFVATTDADNSSAVDTYFIEFSPYFVVLNTVYYVVLGPVAIIGNILSVTVSHRILRFRKSIPDMLTGCLAAVDLLCVISTHTPAVISLAEGRWVGGSPVCSYQYFMAWSCLKTSFFTIILLTVDRFLALTKPFYYRAKVTPRKMKIALACLTIFSFASTSVTIIWFSSEITLLPNWYLCMNTWGKGNQYYSYILAFYGLTFIVGVIIFNVCNTGIVCSLMRHNRRSQQMRLRVLSAAQDRRERRVAKVIETLSALFMLFWMPYLVFIVLHQTNLLYSEFAEDLAIRILFANTLLNPVIYGLFNRTYRKAYIYFVRKLLYFALCGKIKKPKERKIFFLRRSYLQHRYARKTHSHRPRGQAAGGASAEADPPMNGNPPQIIGATPLDAELDLSLGELRDFALDNIGFTLDSEEDLVGASEDDEGIFSISKREDTERRMNGWVTEPNGHLNNGTEVDAEKLTSSEGHVYSAFTNTISESTWL
ncbi:trace amine-associated receptor 9-like isoform X2 [Patiria miniata]|uniref:G-protein coupled receptors family 1 profile domain-containing protein n=1 Tax=Patiria miniata TaxID=46514 RepID=A0A914AAN9_PATMI|nr:trace amine-associated receptor 9-like isoform X2 [Patiria miniata]